MGGCGGIGIPIRVTKTRSSLNNITNGYDTIRSRIVKKNEYLFMLRDDER